MFWFNRWLLITGIFAISASSVVRGEDAPGGQPPAAETQPPPNEKGVAPPAAEASRIEQWIVDLDANKFSQRQSASDKLFEAGLAALPALGKAALSTSREVQTRAIDILKLHLDGIQGELKAAAQAELEKLAKGDNESAKSRAQAALKPKADPNAQPPRRPFVPGIIQIGGGGQIQIQVQAVAGPGGMKTRRVSVKNVNGAKEIESVHGDRKIKISEDPNGIKIEVTDKKDGKDVNEKYEAKNLDELRKNHPEGAKIYDELNKNGLGGVQIGAIQIAPGGAVPLPANPVPLIPGQAIPFPNIQVPNIQVQPAIPKQVENDSHGLALERLQEAIRCLGETRDLLKSKPGMEKDVKEIEERIAATEEFAKRLRENVKKANAESK